MAFKYVPDKKIELPEIEYIDKTTLPAEKTALIIVDMQNDFVHQEGNLHVAAARDTVPKIKKLLDSARELGMKVAYTQDTHFPGDPEWDIWPKHCERGAWGWRIIDELEPQPGERICEKNRYDGFYGTWLEHYLSHEWKVENLVIVGTVANICVAHTAASAGLRWYKIVVPANGISAMTEFDQAMTLRQVSSLYAGEVAETVDQIHFELELEELSRAEA